MEVFKEMKKNKVYCPYCGAEARVRPASAVYGENTKAENADKYLYVCNRYPKCDSYVAAHKKTMLPMGSLANKELRQKRMQAHRAIDRIWKSGIMSTPRTYQWLQAKFGLNEEQMHIAKFSEYMCDQVITACDEVYNRLRNTK
jgi:hypothetical protein